MPDLLDNSAKKSVSVGEFVRSAKQFLESQMPALWVAGEVAQMTRAASGHWYFVLRDTNAQVECIMLARQNALLSFAVKEGDAVEVFARPSLYAPRGRFQLTVRFMRLSGVGELYRRFEECKRQWRERGWFDRARKRPLPFFPSCIGVVGSLSGAAVRDVLRTLKNRMPSIAVIVYPSPAQGREAAGKIAAAIRQAGVRKECDTLVVCRGGGGIEDLWGYNEEAVVRAILDSPIPIVTGIGHEIDETLADYVADARAATPTAAAVLVSPDRDDLRRRVLSLRRQMHLVLTALIDDRQQQVDWALRFFSAPNSAVREKTRRLQQSTMRFLSAARERRAHYGRRLAATDKTLRAPDLQTATARLTGAHYRLAAAMKACWQKNDARRRQVARQWAVLNPQRTLARGYSIVRNAKGRAVSSAAELSPGDELNIRFAQGGAAARVISRNGGAKE